MIYSATLREQAPQSLERVAKQTIRRRSVVRSVGMSKYRVEMVYLPRDGPERTQSRQNRGMAVYRSYKMLGIKETAGLLYFWQYLAMSTTAAAHGDI